MATEKKSIRKRATRKQTPAELVSLVYDLTESADARALVAHVAVAIGLDNPAVWRALSRARAVLEPKTSRRASMAAGRGAMVRLLGELSKGSVTANWIRASLESATGQPAFALIEREHLEAAFRGLLTNPARGVGGRVKGGKGNRSSAAAALASLACACGAWNFKRGEEEKARKLIGR